LWRKLKPKVLAIPEIFLEWKKELLGFVTKHTNQFNLFEKKLRTSEMKKKGSPSLT
jgi:hypothetical protein